MCARNFQGRMYITMAWLKFAHSYLDDLFVLSRGDSMAYLQYKQQILIRLINTDLKLIIARSNFCRTEIDYLGYVVACTGIKPQPKKIEK